MNLVQRCIDIWQENGLTIEQIASGIARLNPDAINNPLLIEDEQIKNCGASIRIFWGLQSAVYNYLKATDQI